MKKQHYNQILFHNLVPLFCDTPLRYIFQLFSTTCLLVWSDGGGGSVCYWGEARAGMFTGSARAPARRARYASVRVSEVATECRWGHVVRRSMVTMVTTHASSLPFTTYNISLSTQPVRHTQTVVVGVYATRIVANAEFFRFISCTIFERKPWNTL